MKKITGWMILFYLITLFAFIVAGSFFVNHLILS